jgi:hypothetical protein
MPHTLAALRRLKSAFSWWCLAMLFRFHPSLVSEISQMISHAIDVANEARKDGDAG